MKGVLARWPFLLLALIGVLLILFACDSGIPPLTAPLERVTGKRPEAKVAAYLEAIRQGDKASAYNWWRPAKEHLGPEYVSRHYFYREIT